MCRLFLASLMLCNSENVSFVDEGTAPGSIATPASLKLELLSSDMQSPLDGYLVPSVAISEK